MIVSRNLVVDLTKAERVFVDLAKHGASHKP